MFNNKNWNSLIQTIPMLIGLVICGVSIFFITHHKWILYDSKDYFSSPMTDMERTEIMSLLEKFIRLLQVNGIEYFSSMGTLIGSIRHHGLIPWDDDIGKNISTTFIFPVHHFQHHFTCIFNYSQFQMVHTDQWDIFPIFSLETKNSSRPQ